VNTADVFRLVDATGHPASDSEYMILAQRLG
jgi:hypothetical protein